MKVTIDYNRAKAFVGNSIMSFVVHIILLFFRFRYGKKYSERVIDGTLGLQEKRKMYASEIPHEEIQEAYGIIQAYGLDAKGDKESIINSLIDDVVLTLDDSKDETKTKRRRWAFFEIRNYVLEFLEKSKFFCFMDIKYEPDELIFYLKRFYPTTFHHLPPFRWNSLKAQQLALLEILSLEVSCRPACTSHCNDPSLNIKPFCMYRDLDKL